jgi:hypothetical protein
VCAISIHGKLRIIEIEEALSYSKILGRKASGPNWAHFRIGAGLATALSPKWGYPKWARLFNPPYVIVQSSPNR